MSCSPDVDLARHLLTTVFEAHTEVPDSELEAALGRIPTLVSISEARKNGTNLMLLSLARPSVAPAIGKLLVELLQCSRCPTAGKEEGQTQIRPVDFAPSSARPTAAPFDFSGARPVAAPFDFHASARPVAAAARGFQFTPGGARPSTGGNFGHVVDGDVFGHKAVDGDVFGRNVRPRRAETQAKDGAPSVCRHTSELAKMFFAKACATDAFVCAASMVPSLQPSATPVQHHHVALALCGPAAPELRPLLLAVGNPAVSNHASFGSCAHTTVTAADFLAARAGYLDEDISPYMAHMIPRALLSVAAASRKVAESVPSLEGLARACAKLWDATDSAEALAEAEAAHSSLLDHLLLSGPSSLPSSSGCGVAGGGLGREPLPFIPVSEAVSAVGATVSFARARDAAYFLSGAALRDRSSETVTVAIMDVSEGDVDSAVMARAADWYPYLPPLSLPAAADSSLAQWGPLSCVLPDLSLSQHYIASCLGDLSLAPMSGPAAATAWDARATLPHMAVMGTAAAEAAERAVALCCSLAALKTLTARASRPVLPGCSSLQALRRASHAAVAAGLCRDAGPAADSDAVEWAVAATPPCRLLRLALSAFARGAVATARRMLARARETRQGSGQGSGAVEEDVDALVRAEQLYVAAEAHAQQWKTRTRAGKEHADLSKDLLVTALNAASKSDGTCFVWDDPITDTTALDPLAPSSVPAAEAVQAVSTLRALVRAECGLRCTVCRLPLPQSQASIPLPSFLLEKTEDEAKAGCNDGGGITSSRALAALRAAGVPFDYSNATAPVQLPSVAGLFTEGGGGEWECSPACNAALTPHAAAGALFLRDALDLIGSKSKEEYLRRLQASAAAVDAAAADAARDSTATFSREQVNIPPAPAVPLSSIARLALEDAARPPRPLPGADVCAFRWVVAPVTAGVRAELHVPVSTPASAASSQQIFTRAPSPVLRRGGLLPLSLPHAGWDRSSPRAVASEQSLRRGPGWRPPPPAGVAAAVGDVITRVCAVLCDPRATDEEMAAAVVPGMDREMREELERWVDQQRRRAQMAADWSSPSGKRLRKDPLFACNSPTTVASPPVPNYPKFSFHPSPHVAALAGMISWALGAVLPACVGASMGSEGEGWGRVKQQSEGQVGEHVVPLFEYRPLVSSSDPDHFAVPGEKSIPTYRARLVPQSDSTSAGSGAGAGAGACPSASPCRTVLGAALGRVLRAEARRRGIEARVVWVRTCGAGDWGRDAPVDEEMQAVEEGREASRQQAMAEEKEELQREWDRIRNL